MMLFAQREKDSTYSLLAIEPHNYLHAQHFGVELFSAFKVAHLQYDMSHFSWTNHSLSLLCLYADIESRLFCLWPYPTSHVHDKLSTLLRRVKWRDVSLSQCHIC